jgi:hypothetical protein
MFGNARLSARPPAATGPAAAAALRAARPVPAGAGPARLLILTGLVLAGLCGCAGGTAAGGGSTAGQPAWAGALGPGVVVTAPRAAGADGSPGGVLRSFVAATDSGHLAAVCPYYPPAVQAQCRTGLASVPASAGTAVSVRDFAVGYVVVDGNKALAGSTGTFCAAGQTPQCSSNGNAAAILRSGKSFAKLWTEAIIADSEDARNTYSLAPLVRIGGAWYMYNPPSGP